MSNYFSVNWINNLGTSVFFGKFATCKEAEEYAINMAAAGTPCEIKTWQWNPEEGKSQLIVVKTVNVVAKFQSPDKTKVESRLVRTRDDAIALCEKAISAGWAAYYDIGSKHFLVTSTPASKPAASNSAPAVTTPVKQKVETPAPAAPVSVPAPAPVAPKVHLWTDGSCKGNGKATNKGGWSAILLCNGTRKELSGGEENTTNNRMELMAVIQGLKALKAKAEVTVHSDSAYFTNAIEKGWLKKWRASGWVNSQKKPVENRDLWEEFVALSKEKCTKLSVEKVAGHSGNTLNEECDALAVAAAEAVK